MIENMKRWLTLRETIDKKEEELKELKNEYDALQDIIWEAMYCDDVDSIVVSGQLIFRTLRLFASPQDKMGFMQWLSVHNEDYIIQEVIHAGTLASWIKDRQEHSKPVPEELLNIYFKPSLGVRKKSQK